MSEILDMSNTPESATPVSSPANSMESIHAKMTAMRNQAAVANEAGTGSSKEAKKEAPVAPEGVEVLTDENDTSSVEPEIVIPETEEVESQDESEAPQEEVSQENSTAEDVIDFIEFATENPNAKFKFMRNGKEMVIDAKQAQAILGQGGAIHEEARQLKIQKAEFDEYLKDQKAQQEGLILAMEFTVKPQLQKAYDEVLKVQGYQATFQQQLAQAQQAQDYAAVARIQAGIQQNEQYIQKQAQTIRELKPKVDQFYDIRKQQVAEVLENSRKSFQDKELKNEYVYKELLSDIAKGWKEADNQLVTGIKNIDLIAADEHLLSLLRDGIKYRKKPTTKSAGASIAQLTTKRGSIGNTKSQDQMSLEALAEKAKNGDNKAKDNLLIAKMNALRGRR